MSIQVTSDGAAIIDAQTVLNESVQQNPWAKIIYNQEKETMIFAFAPNKGNDTDDYRPVEFLDDGSARFFPACFPSPTVTITARIGSL